MRSPTHVSLTPASRTADGRGLRWLALHRDAIVVVLCLAVFAILAWTHRWITDDGFINFRVLDQLFSGNGPVFNRGERIEVGTSPLWLTVLAAGRLVTFGSVPLGWIAAVLGVAFTTVGLAAGAAGSRRLTTADRSKPSSFFPAGLLIVVALPPMWDFATSGLETSLTFGWLGLGYWLVIRRATLNRRLPANRPRGLAVFLGLGVLVRPDLAVFTVGFLSILLISSARGRLEKLLALGWAAAIPVLVQIFRMAYFATILPNTAIAKEAGLQDWGRGWAYLRDFAAPYLAVIPLAVVALVLLSLPWQDWRQSRDWARVAGAIVPVVCGVLSLLYVVRLGGDFMHARMLLPGLFGMCLPAFVWTASSGGGLFRSAGLRTISLTILVAWALATFSVLRVPYEGGIDPQSRISDERGYYTARASTTNPLAPTDFEDATFGEFGLDLHRRAAAGEDVLVLDDGASYPLPQGTGVVAVYGTIGVASELAGTDVHIVDPLGLADPIASRMKLTERGRAGHDKELPLVWVLGRYHLRPPAAATDDILDVEAVMACDPLEALHAATTQPLSLSALLHNMKSAVGLTTLRLDPDPAVTRQELCH